MISWFAPKKYSREKLTINGMVKMVMTLLKAVKDTDNAKSPFAIYEIKLDVGPPGHAAKIIIPTAISAREAKNTAIANPKSGKRSNWFINPIKIALGYKTILLKSTTRKESPIPSIMMNKAPASITVEILSMLFFLKVA